MHLFFSTPENPIPDSLTTSVYVSTKKLLYALRTYITTDRLLVIL